MNIIRLATYLLAAAAMVCSCEKPTYEEDGNGTSQGNNKDNTSDADHDNGGWANGSTGGSGTSGTGTDWQDGDTVGVKKFFTIPEDRAVWLKGYIVGCATGSKGNKYQTVPPFEYETAILIADSPLETDKDNTAAIQLKSGTTARKDLNLKTNPNLHGCKVIIFGAKTQYLKLHGIKTIFAYEIP